MDLFDPVLSQCTNMLFRFELIYGPFSVEEKSEFQENIWSSFHISEHCQARTSVYERYPLQDFCLSYPQIFWFVSNHCLLVCRHKFSHPTVMARYD